MTMPISPEHAGELARLIEHEAKPDLVLIGAVALGHHVPLGRHTSDVDLAVVVSLDDVAPLLGSLGWTRHATMPHRWHGPSSRMFCPMRSDDADERVQRLVRAFARGVADASPRD
jgi:hypothetical protein